jgi:pimeloyl-ACP methyl ester carboxylesterase
MASGSDGLAEPAAAGARTRHVVLLHGQPGSRADWNQVVAALPAKLLPVALDRPGYGANPNPAGNLDTNARAVLGELDAHGVDRAVIGGCSFGGGVALTLAALAPNRVAGLVLVSAIGPGCLNGWDWVLAAPLLGPLCAWVAFGATPPLASARLRLAERVQGRTLHPDEHANWQIWADARGDHGRLWRSFLTEQRALRPGVARLTQLLPVVAAPTVVLADTDDPMVPVRTARELARLLPDARLELSSGAGHHLLRRRPGVVAAALAALAGAGGTPPG